MAVGFLKYVPFVYSVLKTLVDQSKHSHKVKTFDDTKEKIDTIEHLIVKLEKKVSDCRNEIEELRSALFFSRNIIIILLILMTFLVIFMRG